MGGGRGGGGGEKQWRDGDRDMTGNGGGGGETWRGGEGDMTGVARKDSCSDQISVLNPI